MKRRLKRWLFPLVLLFFLALFHKSVLRGMGNYLIVQDEKEKVDAIFVLSGNSFDRGREAAKLYAEGWAPKVVCLGGEVNPALELYGINDLTAKMTEGVLLRAGVPSSAIELLPEGTSTFEEFEAITAYCQARGLDKIMVVSSLFHTRRIHRFFRLRLHLEGIDLVLRGSSETAFDESAWWKNEPGLIFLNNEYIKMGYYWLKY